MCDGCVEHLTHGKGIVRLTKDPHELCHNGFRGHVVSFQNVRKGFQRVADLINADVAAFELHLRGHRRCRAAADRPRHSFR